MVEKSSRITGQLMENCWFYGREELTYHYPTAHVRQKALDFYVVVKIKDVT